MTIMTNDSVIFVVKSDGNALFSKKVSKKFG